MKRFEFRLRRVLDLRRQHAEAERAQLQNLLGASHRLSDDIRGLATQLNEARAHVRHAPSAGGDDYIALAHFESHIQRRTAALETRRQQVLQQIVKQRANVLEADRKLKLLQKLEARHHGEWVATRDKELEALAADSHMARLASNRRHSAA
jgi:flagellar export protein FliJ